MNPVIFKGLVRLTLGLLLVWGAAGCNDEDS